MKKTTVLSVLVGLSLCVSSCGQGDVAQNSADNNTADVQVKEEPTVINIESGGKDLNSIFPLDNITLTSNKNDLQVSMVNTLDGTEVQGKSDGNVWTKQDALQYDTSYHISASSGDTTKEYDVYVPKPLTAEPTVRTPNGETVGVGQTVAVVFDAPVADKALAEKGISIKTTPHVDGAFRWVNDREVRWRPAEFFAPGTKISIDVNNYGQYLGNDIFGGTPTHSEYGIGDARITTIDNATKTVTVTHNGDVVKSFPISLGKPSAPTNNGIYIVGDRNPSMIMDSSTYGVPINSAEGYKLEVNYATQLSYSGIYLHSAPWAMWALGSVNQSHGCINASPEDAKWFMDNSQRGDIVIVKNADGPQLPVDDGLGDWNSTLDVWDQN